ncbi:MAG: hypothetical protein RIS62_179 [Chloroflexota bacterium]|jgi:hypothetical protein
MSEAPTTRKRRFPYRTVIVLVGGMAIFSFLSGGPLVPDPQGPAASAAPTARSSAEAAQVEGLLVSVVTAAGLGPVTSGGDVRPPLPPEMNSLPRTVVRAASGRDPIGIPLVAISLPDTAAAQLAAAQLAAYLAAPVNLVLVPPDAEFSLFRSGNLLVILQRTPSADLDSEAANTLLITLQGMLEEVPIPR